MNVSIVLFSSLSKILPCMGYKPFSSLVLNFGIHCHCSHTLLAPGSRGGGGTWPRNIRGGAAGKSKKSPWKFVRNLSKKIGNVAIRAI